MTHSPDNRDRARTHAEEAASGLEEAAMQGAEPTQAASGQALISAKVPDWSREQCARWDWQPSRQLLSALRDYHRCRDVRGPVAALRRRFAVLRHRFWSAVTGADIPLNCYQLGGGLLMPHPTGIVIHPDAVLGPNCLIFQQVTIGAGERIPGVPKIGGQVDIGAGAKILGGINIGDHAIIGANSVVLRDVPAGGVAIGVPARVTRYRVVAS